MQSHVGLSARRLGTAGHAAHGTAADITQHGTEMHHSRGAAAGQCEHACRSCTAQRAAPPRCRQLPVPPSRWCDPQLHKISWSCGMSSGKTLMTCFDDQHTHIKPSAVYMPVVIDVCRVCCLHSAVDAVQADFVDSREASHTALTSDAASTASLETSAFALPAW
jgi:hypothetical protein